MRVALVFLIVYFLVVKSMVWTEELEREEECDGEEKEDESIENEREELNNERENDEHKEDNTRDDENKEDNTQDDENKEDNTRDDENKEDNTRDDENKEDNTRDKDVGNTEDGVSFHKFSVPVSGEARKVVVPNSNPQQPGSTSIDYRGNPNYSFGYGVHDDTSKNSHVRYESKEGNALNGEYRVLQPDGLVRIVKYSSHPTTGFQAHVSYARY